MNFPLSNREKEQIKEIEEAFGTSKGIRVDNNAYLRLQEILDLMQSLGFIKDLHYDNTNQYILLGDLKEFDDWIADQEKKAKKLSKREWKIAIISAVVGSLIGLIPTIISMIGGM